MSTTGAAPSDVLQQRSCVVLERKKGESQGCFEELFFESFKGATNPPLPGELSFLDELIDMVWRIFKSRRMNASSVVFVCK